MAKRFHAEDALQAAVMDFIARALPGVLAWHTPNGGRRNPREAARLKRQGVLPGIPDVLILHMGCLYGIELKSSTGRLSAAQKEVLPRMEEEGAAIAVCRSVEDVEETLRGWGFTLRATTGRGA